MSRSLKKGPYVEERLLKRIQELNAQGQKRVLKTWSRSSTIFPRWWDIIAVQTDASMCPYISPKTWSVTSWEFAPTALRGAVTIRALNGSQVSEEGTDAWKLRR